MGKKLTVNSFYRVGIIVKDCDEKVKNVCRYFNVDESKIDSFIADSSRVVNATYEGKPLDFLTKVAIVPLANIELEFIQPLDDNGPYAAFLREHGEGVQHFNVDFDDHEGFLNLMEELNIDTLVTGEMPRDGLKWKYFKTGELFGTVFEQEDELIPEDLPQR